MRFKYLGRISDKDIRKYEEAKQNRARYRRRLSEVRKQIRFLEKVLRAELAS